MTYIGLILRFFLFLSSGFISLGMQSVIVRYQDGYVIFSTKMKRKITHRLYEIGSQQILVCCNSNKTDSRIQYPQKEKNCREHTKCFQIYDIAPLTSQELHLSYSTQQWSSFQHKLYLIQIAFTIPQQMLY